MGLVRKCDVCERLETETRRHHNWGYAAINPGGSWSSSQALVCSKTCARLWLEEQWDEVTTRESPFFSAEQVLDKHAKGQACK